MKKAIAILLSAIFLLSCLPMASAASTDEKAQAVVQTALAFYLKDPAMQYDSAALTSRDISRGGNLRNHHFATPEDATPEHNVYTVCSSFCFTVYWNALGYELMGDWAKTATGYLIKAPESLVVMRYDGEGDRDAAIKTLQSFAKPGDIFVTRRDDGTGHAMIYAGDVTGDGKGDLIHSTAAGEAAKYDMDIGYDPIEKDGSIRIDTATETLMSEEALKRSAVTSFALLRPLQADAADCEITPAAKARMAHPMLAINRTASCGYYGSPETGSDLTYTISIENHSKSSYTLPVTETVPNGTALKEAPEAAVSGSELRWSVTIPAGQTKAVSYTVTVTAPRGATIVAGGGSVDGIPSNTLENVVRGKGANAEKLSDTESWSAAVLAQNPTGVQFANAVYKQALGIDLGMTDTESVLSPIIKSVGSNAYYRSSDITSWNQCVPGNFYGGRAIIFQEQLDGEKRAMELRRSYFEAGDIFIAATNYKDKNPTVYVCTGDDLVMIEKGKLKSVSETQLTKSIKSNFYFTIRPTLAYDDISKAVTLPFTDVKSNDWFYTYVKDLYTDGTVSGMTVTTFVPSGNLTYGQALKLIVCALGNPEQAKTGAHWASGYLTFAKNNGWLANDVNLDGAVSRLAFCQIAAKAKNLTEQPSSNPFTDTSDASVLALNKAGVINGMTATTFQPGGILTRAQISKIIWLLRSL